MTFITRVLPIQDVWYCILSPTEDRSEQMHFGRGYHLQCCEHYHCHMLHSYPVRDLTDCIGLRSSVWCCPTHHTSTPPHQRPIRSLQLQTEFFSSGHQWYSDRHAHCGMPYSHILTLLIVIVCVSRVIISAQWRAVRYVCLWAGKSVSRHPVVAWQGSSVLPPQSHQEEKTQPS